MMNLANYKIKFSPLNKSIKGSCRIYGAQSEQHDINILRKKRKTSGLTAPYVIEVKEVFAR